MQIHEIIRNNDIVLLTMNLLNMICLNYEATPSRS